MIKFFQILFISLIACSSGFATDRYVSLTGTNDAVGGYTNWSGAATNIQDAVALATNGETVWVTNGTYNILRPYDPGNTDNLGWNGIQITNAFTLKSVNGATNTIINGNHGVTTGRCIYMSKGVVDGFTISNGYAFKDWNPGWADYLKGGGVFIAGVGTVRNCIITDNYSVWGAGGVELSIPTSSLLENCIIRRNNGSGANGGVETYYAQSGGCIVRNCLITENIGDTGSAGGLKMSSGGITLLNCTIVSNYSKSSGSGGGVKIDDFGGVPPSTFLNNIVYYNRTTNGVDNLQGTNAQFGNNCTFPAITGGTGSSTNNITNEPSFRDLNNANYRLGENSPCINTGTNQSWMTNAVDLSGNQRIRYGFVDMGAYEYIRPAGTIFTVH